MPGGWKSPLSLVFGDNCEAPSVFSVRSRVIKYRERERGKLPQLSHLSAPRFVDCEADVSPGDICCLVIS